MKRHLKRSGKLLSPILCAAMIISMAVMPVSAADGDYAALQTQQMAAAATQTTSQPLSEVTYQVTFPQDQTGYTVYQIDENASDQDNNSKLLTENTAKVLENDSYVFCIQLDEAYENTSQVTVFANGVEIKPNAKGWYVLTDVTADTRVDIGGVTDQADGNHWYTVTASCDPHFSLNYLTDLSNQTMIAGGTVRFTAGPDSAYSKSSYQVLANGSVISPDEDGVYAVKITQDTVIQVKGNAVLDTYSINYVYDTLRYKVKVDGQEISTDTTISTKAQTEHTLTVEKLNESDDCFVTVDGIKQTAAADGSYHLTYTADQSVRVSFAMIQITTINGTALGYNTRWKIVYPEGKSTVGMGDEMKFGIQLLPGYQHSALSIYVRYFPDIENTIQYKKGTQTTDTNFDSTNPDLTSNFYIPEESDPEHGYYQFHILNCLSSSLTLKVGSANAVYATIKPVTPDTYQVRYFYQDSDTDPTVETKDIDYGESITQPKTPTRAGYKFDHWETSTGKTYDFSKAVTQNVNLYAVWKEVGQEQYTITFDSDGGSSVESQTVMEGGSITEPKAPTRKGYTFGGWYTSAGKKYDFSKAVQADMTLTAYWYIPLSDCTLTAADSAVYTGKVIKPAVKVTNGSKTLVKGTDYTVSYANNKNVGRATITITGKGEYKGTLTKTFVINPQATTITSVKASKGRKITITWKKAAGASAYYLYRSTSANGTYTAYKNLATNGNSYTDTAVTAGKTYYYKIRVVKKVLGHSYGSDYSAAKGAKALK